MYVFLLHLGIFLGVGVAMATFAAIHAVGCRFIRRWRRRRKEVRPDFRPAMLTLTTSAFREHLSSEDSFSLSAIQSWASFAD